MQAPDVSIILTAYNFEAYIDAAIQSLLAQQTRYSYEIIIVNDCSTDSTLKRIQAINDSRIYLINNTENQGAAASINAAFALVKGRYVARFDGDDVWLPHFLETTVQVLDQNPDVGLVYGDVAFIDADGVILNPHKSIPDYNGWSKVDILRALLSDYLICAPAILARKDAWLLSLPLPNSLLYCDFEMALYVVNHWELKYIPHVLAHYRIHKKNMHSISTKSNQAEQSIFDTLNRFQINSPTILTDEDWNIIYQNRFLQLGDQYFGNKQIKDARRCYSYGKAYLMPFESKGYFRRWIATFLPNNIYEKVKKKFKKCYLKWNKFS